MESSKIGYQKWAISAYLVAANPKGASSVEMHRDLDMTQKSARFVIQTQEVLWKNSGRGWHAGSRRS